MKDSPIIFILAAYLSFMASFVSGCVLLSGLLKSLPPTDGAYGQSVLQTLMDPFVLTFFIPAALIATGATMAIVYFGLRDMNPRITVPIVVGAVLLELLIVAPFSFAVGWFGAYAALFASIAFCRYSKMKSLKRSK